MATIKDVAKEAGFSVCTVSRALAGKGYIKEETRQRIMEAVRTVDYRPNNLAVSLKTGRTNTLALIIPDVMNMYYPRLEKYIEKYAADQGFMVYLCNSNNDIEREKKFIENLSLKKVDGVIVTPCTNEHQHIKKLNDFGIPYVYLNRNFPDDVERCIRMDNFKGAYDCVSYLLDNGYTRIGGVFQSFNNMIYEERYAGMVKALKDRGIQADKDIILLDVDDLDHSHKRIEKLLKRKHRPQAIFTSNDMLAFGVYRAAYNCGIRIPEDLSVMGYDNIIMTDKIIPPLTSYYTPAEEISRAAVEYICACISGKEADRFPIYEGKLVLRDSVRPC